MATSSLDDKAIFNVARKIDNLAARQVYLQKICSDDLDRLARVTSLLSSFDEQSQFLEAPAVDLQRTFVSPEPTESTGTKIGPYKIREQLGEGGMGVVYAADQKVPVRRTVALKIIKAGMDTGQVIARFEAERQTLAMMDHPGIAKVIDAGSTETGRPYFVMELIRGLPITQYCDQARMTMPQRLELFISVCQAVQHAHQKGIIHRDLKPSNVMVTEIDGQPVAKVIDFGVAKATAGQLTGQTIYTKASQMVGTPLYMSPEQAGLSGVDVDTRSDVYSLGVMLYELLSGSTPFDRDQMRQAGYEEMRRIIREDEPPRPSHRISTLKAEQRSTISDRRQVDAPQLGRQVERELDWIVMKALEKDRVRRYESASALSRDIQRHLDGELVQACPPSMVYKLRKYARRNKAVLVTATLVVASLLTGTGVSAWQAIEANHQRQEAVQGRQEAQEQREVAILERNLTAEQRRIAVFERNGAVQQRKLALSNQYSAEIVSGQADWERGNIGSLHRKLVGHLPVQGDEDRRGWEWYYLYSLCHPEERTIGGNGFASWSPDGEYVGAAGAIWKAQSGECVRRYSTSNILRKKSTWSPDGQKFAWGMAADDNGILHLGSPHRYRQQPARARE